MPCISHQMKEKSLVNTLVYDLAISTGIFQTKIEIDHGRGHERIVYLVILLCTFMYRPIDPLNPVRALEVPLVVIFASLSYRPTFHSDK